MATKDDWRGTFAQLTADPVFKSLDPGTQQAQRVRFFQNRVQMSPEYQKADPKVKQGIELNILGDVPGLEATPEPTPVETPGALPSPVSPAPRPEAGGMLANVLGRLGSFGREQLKPGGLISPEAQGTVGGGLIGGALAGPPGAFLGAGVGGLAGRGYEMLTSPSEAPADLSSGVSELGQASQRGMLAEAGGQLLGKGLGALGNRLRAPMGLPERGTVEAMQAADEFGVPITAGQATGSRKLQLLEDIPQRLAFGGGRAQEFAKAQIAKNEAAVLKLAEERLPGLKQDLSDVGAGMQSAMKARGQRAQAAVSSLYDHSKELVGDGQFAMPSLEQAAGSVVQTEKPLATLASSALRTAKPFSAAPPDPVQAALAEAGFESGKTYGFGDILSIKQRLGNVIRRTSDKATRRELSIMQAAVGQDLIDAAEAAGATEAIPVLKRANDFYFKHIVGTYNDPAVLKAIANRPSLAAKMFLNSNVPVEAVSAFRKAIGPNSPQLAAVTRAWYEDLAMKASPGGNFNAGRFAESVRKMPPEVVRTITRGQSNQFNRLMSLFQKEGQGLIAQGSSRASLSTGQVLGIIAGNATASIGLPQILSRILYTETGIRWLTVGLEARAGTQASVTALSKLAGIAATRPAVGAAVSRMAKVAGL